MNLNDIPDRTVEIEERELVYILACAASHQARLPYGMIPPTILMLLSREGRRFLAGDASFPAGQEERRRGP